MSDIKVKEPVIIKNVLSDEEHKELKIVMQNWPMPTEWDGSFGRHLVDSPVIDEYGEKLIPLA
jgi:hypothetical protein